MYTKTLQTNGYVISDELQNVLDQWMKFLSDRLPVERFDFFYYGEKYVFADCRLTNGNYGEYGITRKLVHFNGWSASSEECEIFRKATWNDECFNGELMKEGNI